MRSRVKPPWTAREACPACGSDRVRYSERFIKNLRRWGRGSPARHCLACGRRWHLDRDDPVKVLRLRDYELAAILAAMAAGILLIDAAIHPVRRLKTEVRAYYDRTYGEESRRMLWEHFGVFYRSKDRARLDYDLHQNAESRKSVRPESAP